MAELPPGKSLSIEFAGERVAPFNVAGRIYAIGAPARIAADRCPKDRPRAPR